jgi:hypothetical protein
MPGAGLGNTPSVSQRFTGVPTQHRRYEAGEHSEANDNPSAGRALQRSNLTDW